VVVLLALASTAWLITDRRMAGMDAGPWTDPGPFGFYITAWVVMMAAMMLPSIVPMVLMFSRLKHARSTPAIATSAFVIGYLVVWTASGLVAYAALKAGQAAGIFTWDRFGRPMTVGALLAAALYEMTPIKTKCLRKCRSPLGFLLGSWRDRLRGAFTMGTRHGAWCLGCCWALMVALFALGGNEPHLDARGCRADRSREVVAVAQGGDRRRFGAAACVGDWCGGGASERALVDRTDDRTDGRTYVMA